MPRSKHANPAMTSLKRVLVIGSGGRENSLAWAIKKCSVVEDVWVSPGNGGTKNLSGCKQLLIEEQDFESLKEVTISKNIDLVVIGPEAPLEAGLADFLRDAGIAVFGPGAKGAQLEASKSWAKELMRDANIPTAKYWAVGSQEEALSILKKNECALVVKLDGLAAGKGVIVPSTLEETEEAIKAAFKGEFGSSGQKLLLEERLEGPEVSVFALCDGERFIILPTAQDHKRLKEGDKGPNTGGMGSYAPAQILSDKQLKEVAELILEPTLKALKDKNIDYRGVIYAGLMVTSQGPKVIEFNCRFGDPECQTLMPLMGAELADVLHACALGTLDKAPKLFIKNECSACVVAAAGGYPESPSKGNYIKIDIPADDKVQLFHAGTRRNESGELFTAGGRVLSVVAQSDSFDKAFAKAYQNMDRVDFEGITYRRDIGHQVRQSENVSK